MLTEVLEQTGVARLVGRQEQDVPQDSLLAKAWVSHSKTMSTHN